MSFKVNLYNFSKKANSTARPTGSGTEYNCVILQGSGMMSPSISLNLGTSTAPAYNYAYISNFGRYYFISEWTFSGALWTASLSCDTLATYKSEIGAASLYALRTSNSSLYDGSIVDKLYPVKAGCTFNDDTAATLPWTYSISDGAFSLGVVSSDPDYGSIKYFIVSPTTMRLILKYLLSDDLMTDNNFSTNDATFELQKSLIDPVQYIKSCVYIPIPWADVTAGLSSEALKIFNWQIKDNNVDLAAYVVPGAQPFTIVSRSFTIADHPQAVSRGIYVNQAPYTTRVLVYPPFGAIELDTTVLANTNSVSTECHVDMLTGRGVMEVKANGIVLNKLESQIGVPVQLSQITRDYIGGVSSILGGIAGGISGFMFGNIAGGVASAFSAIGSAAEAMSPRAQTIGQGGSFAQLDGIAHIYSQFFTVVDDDVASNGRPCCKIVNPSSGGYFLIQDADVPINGTEQEYDDITRKMEGGFYWE